MDSGTVIQFNRNLKSIVLKIIFRYILWKNDRVINFIDKFLYIS